MEETRVGYVGISVLAEIVKEYIMGKTVDGKYTGDLHYTQLYQQMDAYLKDSKVTSPLEISLDPELLEPHDQ